MSQALLDTCIAVRAFDIKDAQYAAIQRSMAELVAANIELVIAPQVLFESRVVLTRPKSDRGPGRSALEFGSFVDALKGFAALLPDPPDLVERWMALCEKHHILGKRSHDARLVAWMQALGVGTILTLNPRDFAAFEIDVIAPGNL